ncbi:MAG: hypothetical protein IJS68_01815 [Clostridia bacterium]|nr:hypothetical protein [Clostridia bacterium]
MKQFVYPAVCYKDDEFDTISLLLPDVDIVASGATCEDAFISAKSYLKSYIDWSVKLEGDLPEATSFEDTVKLNPKRSVLLVDATSNAVKADVMSAEQKLKNIMAKYFD